VKGERLDTERTLELIRSVLEKEQIRYLFYSRETEREQMKVLKDEMQTHQMAHQWEIKLKLEKNQTRYDLVFSPAGDEEGVKRQMDEILLDFSRITPGVHPGRDLVLPSDKSYRDLNFQIFDANPTLYNLEEKMALLTKLEKSLASQFRSIKEQHGIKFSACVEHHAFLAPEISKQYSLSNYSIAAELVAVAANQDVSFTVSQTRHTLAQAVDTTGLINQIQVTMSNFSNQSIIYGKETNVLITQQALVKLLNFIAQCLVIDPNRPSRVLNDPQIQYFDAAFTLKDDATLTGGPMTRPFDAEGVNCAGMSLITDGYISRYICDQAGAALKKTAPTGHAWYDDQWNYQLYPSNLIMDKGRFKMDELMLRLDPGITLNEISELFLDNHDNLHIFGRGQVFKQGKNMNGIRGLHLVNPWNQFFRKMNLIANEPLTLDNVTGYPILMESVYATSN